MQPFIEEFVEQFGEPTKMVRASAEQIEALSNTVPDAFLECVKELGFSEFQNGLFRLVDPIAWEPTAFAIAENSFLREKDRFLPVAVGGFGHLDLFGLQSALYPRIRPITSELFVVEQDEVDSQTIGIDEVFRQNFSAPEPNDYDVLDDDENELFETVFQKLGPLGEKQYYGLPVEVSFYDENFHQEFQIMEFDTDLVHYVEEYPLEFELL